MALFSNSLFSNPFSGCPYCNGPIPYNAHTCPNDPKTATPIKAAYLNGIVGEAPEPESDSSEPRLFTGTLQGYRHFALASTGTLATTTNPRGTKTFTVTSSSQHYAPGWTDGENIAVCDQFAYADKRDMFGQSRYTEIQNCIRELKDKLARSIDEIVEWEDIEITTFPDPNPVYIRTPRRRTVAEIQSWKIELAHRQRWMKEYKRYQENKHRMKDCSCGFYVGYNPLGDFYAGQFAATPGLKRICLHAVVECYGKIVLGTKGFRAQKLRIVAMAPYRREAGLWEDVFGNYEAREGKMYYPLPLPVPDMACAVKAQMPGVRWFDVQEDMLLAYPEPDRTGLVQDNHTDYGMGNGI